MRRWLERVSGWQLERVGGRSYALVDRRQRADAWIAPHWQLRRLIEDFRVDLVLDVGANDGRYGRDVRRIYAGELHSFEPEPSSYARLTQAASRDARWQVHAVALGAAESSGTLRVTHDTVLSSLHPSNAYAHQRFGQHIDTVRTVSVAVRRLDRVLAELVPDIAQRRVFLKTDTQGHDLDVFDGLGALQSAVVALCVEVSLIPIYDGMPHWTDSIAAFERAGLQVSGMVPVAWDGARVIEYDCLMVRP